MHHNRRSKGATRPLAPVLDELKWSAASDGQILPAHRPCSEETAAGRGKSCGHRRGTSNVWYNLGGKCMVHQYRIGALVLVAQLAVALCDFHGRTSTYIRAPTVIPTPGHSGTSAVNIFESQTICQSYKELCPPLHRRSNSLDSDGFALRARADGLRLRHNVRPVCNEAVLILDLDKTSIFGNDGNDLGISLQWMEKPDHVVQDLYKLLVSPCVRPAYEDLKARARNVHVVIYTRRPQVLRYQSAFRECVVPIQYRPEWHHEGQFFLPPTVRCSDEVMHTYCGPELLDDEVNDVTKSLERLLAARDALTEALGLAAPPTVVVTATDKCVEDTVRHLDLPEGNAVLFDDNTALKYDPKTIVVSPFEALPEARRRPVQAFMERHLPTEDLDKELVEYLEGARESERALQWDESSGVYQWRVPSAAQPIAPWRRPQLKSDGSPWDRASDSGFGLPPWASSGQTAVLRDSNLKPALIGPPATGYPRSSKSNACLSPVTPELVDGLEAGRVDLRAVAERAAQLREQQALRRSA